MKIFLSYPSSREEVAEEIVYALQSEEHDVFFDKSNLPSGQGFIRRIRDAIEESDLFIFLVTPDSVMEGRYTRTELRIARETWPRPTGRVLPVIAEPTSFDDIPKYLASVTMLSPEGNIGAEVALAVADLESGPAGEEAEQRSDGSDRAVTDDSSASYLPIEIRFGSEVASQYVVTVSDLTSGDRFDGTCSLDASAMDEQLWSSAGRIEGSVRRARTFLGETFESLMPSSKDAEAVGSSLHQSLLASPIRPSISARFAALDPQYGEGLRFLINTTESPDLARLPWEFLYDAGQDDFVFLDRMKTVIRTLDVDRPAPSLALQAPVRLLVVVAAPEGRPELRVGDEIAQMDDALRDLAEEQRVEIIRLDHATLERLDEALLRMKPHALHFIGHGDFDGDEGVVVLESSSRQPDPISGRQLGVLLRNHLRTLRLVFLNSCLGAAVPVGDPFGGVAQNLVRRGVPAVIAMQFAIPDAVAVALARHFYRYLASGTPLDEALTSARAFLFARGYGVEWGAPALYMPANGAFLVDAAAAPPVASVPPPVHVPSDVDEALDRVVPSGADAMPTSGIPPASEDAPFSESVGAPVPPTALVGTASAEERRVARSADSPDVRSSVPLGPAADRRRGRAWLVAALVILGIVGATLAANSRASRPTSVVVAAPSLSLPETATTSTTLPSAGPDATLGAAITACSQNASECLEVLDAAELADPGLAQIGDADRLTILENATRAAEIELREQLERGPAEWDLALAESLTLAILEIEPGNREAMDLHASLLKLLNPREVVVGDTLWGLAEDEYGDPRLWPTIFLLNRDRIADPDLIFPGQQFPIPPRPQFGDPQPPGLHVVVAGDTLSRIAEATYGDSVRWPEIYAANQAQIDDPDLIFPGQVLVIP